MKALLLTNEYPPYTYGGAGVHVEYLSRELSRLLPVEVRSFGDQESDDPQLSVYGTEADTSGYSCPAELKGVFGALQRSLNFNTRHVDADIVHCHTWYTHMGGIMAKLIETCQNGVEVRQVTVHPEGPGDVGICVPGRIEYRRYGFRGVYAWQGSVK